MTSVSLDASYSTDQARLLLLATAGAARAIAADRADLLRDAQAKVMAMAASAEAKAKAKAACRACAGKHRPHTCGKRNRENTAGCLACAGKHRAHTCGWKPAT